MGDYELKPNDAYLCALAFIMNPQATGSVTLRSADPSANPIIQPNLANHPFDRRVIIEALRDMWKLLEAPVLKKDTVQMVGIPRGRSDEEIWVTTFSFRHLSIEICN
jgi:choline dehydrogenase-like flavoprotein